MPTSRTRQTVWTAAALVIAAVAGWAAAAAHLPLPWMLGPLFSIAILRVAGLPLLALPGGRQAGQWAIGTALGLYFTPAVLGELGRHMPAILLMAGSAVIFGLAAARLLERWGQVTPATAFFAGLPGGASEMVVLAERHGGQIDRIAAAHALRVMLVVSIIPFALHHGAREGHETFRALAGTVDWMRFPLLLAASLTGVVLFAKLRIANAWVLGPLLCIGVLTAANLPLTSLPGWLVNGGQLLLGTALGTRFSPSFFRAAPRFLSVSAGATALTLVLCALFVGTIGWLIPIPFASLLLAASPGGMAEMSITAREMHLSVPLVTATHVLRVVLLTACAPLLCRYYLAWRHKRSITTTGDKP
ncbi:AbrB family transcriptional regulator [Dechloromonas sp. CZR5]|uniref:AbrB family transcriptional regulator n=1 Tax=Dechloromonas sp. CZR5 TaxID=2608630 RepID=UPI00123D091B|nr:AbrB family transcriptional regulator [Dechloromonas sp. CZR5]